ncbi:MAG: methyltransferase domain-containing protein [Pirellulaceae bacterium]
MRQTLSEIQQAYDLAASTYAERFLDELSHKPRDVELLQRFAQAVGAGQRVLDLGCGPGHTTAHLSRLGLKPTGLDLSPEMVRKASSLFPNVDFTVGDFLQLADHHDSVAGILAFYCIVHLQRDQLVTAFREMFRVLKSDGVLLLAFHIGSEAVNVPDFLGTGAVLEFYPFLVPDVQSALHAAGFSEIEVHVRPPYETEYPTNRCYLFAFKHLVATAFDLGSADRRNTE